MPVMMNPFIITDRYAGPEYFYGKVQAPTFRVYYFSV